MKRFLAGLFGFAMIGNSIYVMTVYDAADTFVTFANLAAYLPLMVVCVISIYVGLVLVKFGVDGEI